MIYFVSVIIKRETQLLGKSKENIFLSFMTLRLIGGQYPLAFERKDNDNFWSPGRKIISGTH